MAARVGAEAGAVTGEAGGAATGEAGAAGMSAGGAGEASLHCPAGVPSKGTQKIELKGCIWAQRLFRFGEGHLRRGKDSTGAVPPPREAT